MAENVKNFVEAYAFAISQHRYGYGIGWIEYCGGVLINNTGCSR